MLNAFSSIVTSFLDGARAQNMQNKENAFNAGEAQLNRDFQDWQRLMTQEFDLDMWNLNNEYNSLSSQLQRARDAGVSPNAILSGDYKGGFSNPVSSTPMSGAQASANNAGALGSAMLGRSPSMLNALSNSFGTVGDFIKNMTDSKVALKQVQLNEKMINSNIDHNLASIQKLLSDVGVNEASAEQIKKATSWMDQLNDLEVQERAARVTNWYNQNYKILQEIKNLEAEEKLINAKVDNVKADTAYIESKTDYQDTLNKYVDRQQSALTSTVEYEAAIVKLKKELADELGVPLDTPEFLFNWYLAINGKFEEFVDKVIIPKDRATWKPRDYSVDNKFMQNVNTEYFWHFDPRKGIVNPRANDINDLSDFWSDYYKTMSQVDAIKAKYKKKYQKK